MKENIFFIYFMEFKILFQTKLVQKLEKITPCKV